MSLQVRVSRSGVGISVHAVLASGGLRAELVGSEAANAMVSELKSGAGVDRNLADQLIPYIGLAGGGSLTVRELSSHTETSIHVVEQLLNVNFVVDRRGDVIRISL